jgi:tetratricopeptide (TPR) repeat protein
MPPPEEAQSPVARPLVPVSAEDFAARKRRIVFTWIGAGLLVALVGIWTYRRSVTPLEAQQSLEDGQRQLKATHYAEAVLAFNHALTLKSDLADAYLYRGRANTALGNNEGAIQDFTRVIQLRPQGAEAFVERAAARLEQQDYPGVIADCGDALKRDSRLAIAYNMRATALRETGKPEQALEDLNRAVEIEPQKSNYFQRAATYEALGQHQKALADLDEVIAQKPDGPQAYFARARSRIALGDVAGAKEDRRRALSIIGATDDANAR